MVSLSTNKLWLQRILHFIIAHALWVSLCAASLVFQTMQLASLPVNSWLIAFVFFATLSSYNFHYAVAGFLSDENASFKILLRRPAAVLFFAVGITGCIVCYCRTNVAFIATAVAGLLTFLYSLPLLPFKQLAFTRKAGFVKTLLLAFTWMYVTAYLPLSETAGIGATGWLIMTKRFLFMLMLCILFDNRDIQVDEVNGLHSLSTDLAPATVRFLIYFVFSALFFLNFFLGKYGATGKQVAALQLSAFINLIVYYFSSRKQGYFFYYFIVDGMMLLMTFLTAVASI